MKAPALQMYVEEGKENGCVISISRSSWDRERRKKDWERSLVIKRLYLNGPRRELRTRLSVQFLLQGSCKVYWGRLGQAPGQAGPRPQG